MEFDFLSPVDTDLIIDLKRLSSQHLSNKVVFHTQEDFPDISDELYYGLRLSEQPANIEDIKSKMKRLLKTKK